MNTTDINKARIEAYNKKHVNDTAFAITDEWDESKHPRAANGQFGSGGGSAAPKAAKTRKAKATPTPAAKPAPKAKSTEGKHFTNMSNEEALPYVLKYLGDPKKHKADYKEAKNFATRMQKLITKAPDNEGVKQAYKQAMSDWQDMQEITAFVKNINEWSKNR